MVNWADIADVSGGHGRPTYSNENLFKLKKWGEKLSVIKCTSEVLVENPPQAALPSVNYSSIGLLSECLSDVLISDTTLMSMTSVMWFRFVHLNASFYVKLNMYDTHQWYNQSPKRLEYCEEKHEWTLPAVTNEQVCNNQW